MTRIDEYFYRQSTVQVAKSLLGCRIVRCSSEGIVAGRVVETEAYLSENDLACHAARGVTPRNKTMFGPAGSLYVYTIHTHFCMNIVTEPIGRGAAVLIRGLEPDCGLEIMRSNRPINLLTELTNGPGKLCQSLGIDLDFNGENLLASNRIWIEPKLPELGFVIQSSPRIGIRQAKEHRLRFFIDGNRFVSGRACDHSIPRKECLIHSD